MLRMSRADIYTGLADQVEISDRPPIELAHELPNVPPVRVADCCFTRIEPPPPCIAAVAAVSRYCML